MGVPSVEVSRGDAGFFPCQASYFGCRIDVVLHLSDGRESEKCERSEEMAWARGHSGGRNGVSNMNILADGILFDV
jgi:hypothetical protein